MKSSEVEINKAQEKGSELQAEELLGKLDPEDIKYLEGFSPTIIEELDKLKRVILSGEEHPDRIGSFKKYKELYTVYCRYISAAIACNEILEREYRPEHNSHKQLRSLYNRAQMLANWTADYQDFSFLTKLDEAIKMATALFDAIVKYTESGIVIASSSKVIKTKIEDFINSINIIKSITEKLPLTKQQPSLITLLDAAYAKIASLPTKLRELACEQLDHSLIPVRGNILALTLALNNSLPEFSKVQDAPMPAEKEILLQTLNALHNDMEQYITTGFFDDFPSKEVEKKTQQYTEKILSIIDNYSTHLNNFKSMLEIAPDLLSKLPVDRSEVAQYLVNTILQPASDSIWQLKNNLNIVLLQWAGGYPLEIKQNSQVEKDMPVEIKKLIALTSAEKALLLKWRQVSKTYKNLIDNSYLLKSNPRKLYFATGKNIRLCNFIQHYTENGNRGCIEVKNIMDKDVKKAMKKQLEEKDFLLFDSLEKAAEYSKLSSVIHSSTVMKVISEVPIFIVSLGSLIVVKASNEKVKSRHISCLKTPSTNIANIHFSKLYQSGQFFDVNPTKRQHKHKAYSKIWESVIAKANTKEINNLAKICVQALFEKYNNRLTITRNNNLVDSESIIKYANENSDIDKIIKFIEEKYSILKTDKNAEDFLGVVTFALENLYDLKQIQEMTADSKYLTNS